MNTLTVKMTLAENSLFSLEEMGIPLTEWEQLQSQLRDKLFLGNSFFFPGNTPSLKNSKEIHQIYTKTSFCCKAPITRFKDEGKMVAICSACHKTVKATRPILAPSKAVESFKKKYEGYFLVNKQKFLNQLKNRSKPYILGFYFIRETNAIFDYGNAKHIILDLMVKHNYFEDDNANIIMDYPLGYHVDKLQPGCYVIILNNTFFRTLLTFI